jgi:cell pole-organizing protein PopZ
VATIVDPYTAAPGAVIAAAEINARIAAILAQCNGNLDAANIKDSTVTSRKAKLTAGVVRSTGGLSGMGAVHQDIPGASIVITPDVASLLIVHAKFHVQLRCPNNLSTAKAFGVLSVDGVEQTASAFTELASASDSGYVDLSMAEFWVVPLTAAAHTVKLRGLSGGNTGTGTSDMGDATFSYILVAS